ncbi:MAG: GTPase [bacterium JZ-2024 1]
MKFVDFVAIEVKAGDGGNGAVSFRREKYRPRMGPDGGDGGKGGSVFIEGDPEITSLASVARQRRYAAERGEDGSGGRKHGHSGKNLVIKVPIGTVIRDADRRVIAELSRARERVCVAHGGKPGRGNAAFKNARMQTPHVAEEGQPGERARLYLDLLIPNDVALVGFPASGKSLLLSSITGVSVRTGPYGFVTASPQWGYFTTNDYQRVKILDLPPVRKIESDDSGQGISVNSHLKHIRRSAIVALVASVAIRDGAVRGTTEIVSEIKDLLTIVYREVQEARQKTKVVVLTKLDLVAEPPRKEEIENKLQIETFMVSNTTGVGISLICSRLAGILFGSGQLNC